MTVYRHAARWRADIFAGGKRVDRKTFATKPEALHWEKIQNARYLLSDEERYQQDVTAWATHHRFVEKPDYMVRLEEGGIKAGLLAHLEKFGNALPARGEGCQPTGSMLVYVPDPVARPEPVDLKSVSKVTLKEAMETYRDKVTPTHKPTSRKPETIKINKIIRDEPHLVRKKILSLTKGDFTRYRDERFEVVARSTVKGEIKLFRRVINWARDELKVHIVENPAAGIRFPSGTDVERDRRLIGDEEARLVARANPLLADIIVIATDTAMREGEIVRITPKWFREFGTRRAHLRLPQETKNETPRSVPLTRRVEKILTRRAKSTPMFPILAKTVTNKFIELKQRLQTEELCQRRKLTFTRQPTVRDLYHAMRIDLPRRPHHPNIDDLCAKCGIDDLQFLDLHFHDLRHEAINRWADLGLSDIAIMKASGHRSLPAALRYRHPDVGALTQALRA